MHARWVVCGVILGLAVAVSPGCSGSQTCGPSNCGGCCTAEGKCEPGSTHEACGLAGGACLPCSAFAACQGGTCVPLGTGQSDSGVPGGDGGVTDGGGPSCNPSTCLGCCLSNGQCAPGSAANACGVNGEVCTSCASGSTCANGACQAPTSCNPSTCASGCCAAGGTLCLSGKTNTNCGSGGATCFSCASSEACTPVSNGGACQPIACAGCVSNGTCYPGSSDAACGVNGDSCVACGANRTCSNGACVPTPDGGTSSDAGVPPCNPSTCSSGCCAANGTICLQGKSFTNCGSGGKACTTCGNNQSCVVTPNGGACQTNMPPPPSVYGSACNVDADCAGIGPAAICRQVTASGNASYPGGYCTQPCSASSPCQTGGVCLGLASSGYGETDLCADTCSSSDPCRSPGYACYQLVMGGSACWLDPLPPLDAGLPPPNDLIGSPCAQSADCNDGGYTQGSCYQATNPDGGPSGWTGGYCVGDCSVTGCGNTAKCFSLGSTGSQTCLDLCTAPGAGQSDCRSGYVCDSYQVVLPDGGIGAASDGVCWPSCNAPGWSCSSGQTCDSAGYCQ